MLGSCVGHCSIRKYKNSSIQHRHSNTRSHPKNILTLWQVQHGQILITLLLQHAELPHHTITVKAQIFMTTTQFFTESTGYFMQILDSLVKHMVSSVEVCLPHQYLCSCNFPELCISLHHKINK